VKQPARSDPYFRVWIPWIATVRSIHAPRDVAAVEYINRCGGAPAKSSGEARLPEGLLTVRWTNVTNPLEPL